MTHAEWVPVDGRELEPSALEVILSNDNVLVIAGPGAGKTEMLAQKACYLLQTGVCAYPKRILAVSFKREAAAELEERVNDRCGSLARGCFTSFTFDAFAKSILDKFRFALPEEMRPSADYFLGAAKDDALIKKLARERCDCMRNGRPDPGELEKVVVSAIEKEGVRSADEALKALLAGNGDQRSHLTYRMVFALARRIIENNSTIKRAIRLTYSYVFLDEFQDITYPQYKMMESLFHNKALVTAVGDDKQGIMGFAGAMQDSFAKFEKDYGTERIELYWNHRSAPRLVALQKEMYGILGKTADGVIHHGNWKEGDGELTLLKSSEDSVEAIWLAGEIDRLLKASVPAKEIAVLRKRKTPEYVDCLIQELGKLDIRSLDESSNEIDPIVSDDFLRFLLNFACIALGSRDENCWLVVRRSLTMLLGFYCEEEYAELHFHDKEVEERKTALGRQLREASSTEDIERAFSNICLNWIGIENIASTNSSYSRDYLNERLSILSKALYMRMKRWGSVKDGIEILLGKNTVRLMTIHKSKGMEFEYVFLVGLEDYAFWGMGKEELDCEADRRAFFVALSRAKKSITISYCKHRKIKGHERQECAHVQEFYDILKKQDYARIVDLIDKSLSSKQVANV